MAEAIRGVLQDVLRATQQQHGALHALQKRWRDVVGSVLAAHARPVSVRKKRLVICVDRPGAGHALSYQRRALLAKIREVCGDAVEEIVIRPGDVGPRTAHAVSDRANVGAVGRRRGRRDPRAAAKRAQPPRRAR